MSKINQLNELVYSLGHHVGHSDSATAPYRQNYGKKKRFNLQAPPVYDRKVTNLFFSIIIVSIIIFFHNSVGDCMSIDSQFECILRGNIEL